MNALKLSGFWACLTAITTYLIDPCQPAECRFRATAETTARRPDQNPDEGLQTLESECVSLSEWYEGHTISRLRLRRLIVEYTFSGGYVKIPKLQFPCSITHSAIKFSCVYPVIATRVLKRFCE